MIDYEITDEIREKSCIVSGPVTDKTTLEDIARYAREFRRRHDDCHGICNLTLLDYNYAIRHDCDGEKHLFWGNELHDKALVKDLPSDKEVREIRHISGCNHHWSFTVFVIKTSISEDIQNIKQRQRPREKQKGEKYRDLKSRTLHPLSEETEENESNTSAQLDAPFPEEITNLLTDDALSYVQCLLINCHPPCNNAFSHTYTPYSGRRHELKHL